MAKFIVDKPIHEDYFKTHENISESIIDVIENNSLIKRRVIALLGSWGSGKSSVIEILKEKSKDISRKVIVFNTWANKGELLRRNFLYEIAKSTNSLDKTYKKDSEVKIKDIITGKITERKVKNVGTNYISKLFAYFIIIIVIIYILLNIIIIAANFTGYDLKLVIYGAPETIQISDFEKFPEYQREILKKYYKKSDIRNNYILKNTLNKEINEIGNILASLNYKHTIQYNIKYIIYTIIIILMIFFVICKFSETVRDKFFRFVEGPIRSLFPYAGLNVIEIEENTTSIEKSDLSIYDFREIYSKIVKDKQIIIALENLDRVDDITAIDMLNNLEIFLDIESEKGKVTNDIWFIVPIDEDKLKKIIENSLSIKNDEDFSEHYIEKMFTVKFYVPSIYNKNWKDYFIKKFNESFIDEIESKDINLTENEAAFICRIFSKGRKRELGNLTPREIIYYINEIVSIYLFIKNIDIEIDLKSISIYALYKSYYSNNNDLFEDLEKFNSKIKPEKINDFNNFIQAYNYVYTIISGPEYNLRNNLFSIHYQTEKPYDTIYSENLWNYALAGNIENIKEIINDGGDEIIKLLESKIFENINDLTTVNEIGNILLCLEFAKNGYYNNNEVNCITEVFSIENVQYQDFNEKSSEGISKFLNNIKKENIEIFDKIIKNMDTNFKRVPLLNEEKNIQENFLNGYIDLIENIGFRIKLDLIEYEPDKIREILIHFCSHAKSKKYQTTLNDIIINYKGHVLAIIKLYLTFYTEGNHNFFNETDYDIIRVICDLGNEEFNKELNNLIQNYYSQFIKSISKDETQKLYDENPFHFYIWCFLVIYLQNNGSNSHDINEIANVIAYHLNKGTLIENKIVFIIILYFYSEIDKSFEGNSELVTATGNIKVSKDEIEKNILNAIVSIDSSAFKNVILEIKNIYYELEKLLERVKLSTIFLPIINKIFDLLSSIISEENEKDSTDYILSNIFPKFCIELRDIEDKEGVYEKILEYIVSEVDVLNTIFSKIRNFEECDLCFLNDIEYSKWSDEINEKFKNLLIEIEKQQWEMLIDSEDSLEFSIIKKYTDNTIKEKENLGLTYHRFGVPIIEKTKEKILTKTESSILEYFLERISYLSDYDHIKKDLNSDLNRIVDNFDNLESINYKLLNRLIEIGIYENIDLVKERISRLLVNIANLSSPTENYIKSLKFIEKYTDSKDKKKDNKSIIAYLKDSSVRNTVDDEHKKDIMSFFDKILEKLGEKFDYENEEKVIDENKEKNNE